MFPNKNKTTVLVTGGCGYIGSHTVLELLSKCFNVIVVDDLSNSHKEPLNRIYKLVKRNCIFYKISITDKKKLTKVFKKHKIDAVIHFAGLKAVNESISQPLKYYDANVVGTTVLLQCMQNAGCHNIVFSSSATVYGQVSKECVDEEEPLCPINPYGRTKLVAEYIIKDFCDSNENMNAAALRYFNPIGAHCSGLIGENPLAPPNNLLPCVTKSMINPDNPLKVFGNDYNTHDGTAIRDFIHVCDLAAGHVAALLKLIRDNPRFVVYNMGNGRGYTVKEIICHMEDVTGIMVPYEMKERRNGDAEKVVADPTRAFTELDWKPHLSVSDMCQSAWNWQKKNPNGYAVERFKLFRK